MLVCTEAVYRAAVWDGRWTAVQAQVKDPGKLSPDQTAVVVEDATAEEQRLEAFESARIGLVFQTLFCLLAMVVNNAVWVCRKSFAAKWHVLHHFTASVILVLFLPRTNWWPAMTNIKFLYTVGNILLFQMLLNRIASLTETH